MHLLAAAFDVGGTHPICDGLALFWRDGCETLCLEQVDAGSLGAEIGFQAHQDEWGGGTEMKDFWIPLRIGQYEMVRVVISAQPLTLSMIFSSEFGQSIAKQTNRRSVSG